MEYIKDGEGLQEIIREAGYTQEEVADIAGISPQSLWRSLTGNRPINAEEKEILEDILFLSKEEEKRLFIKKTNEQLRKENGEIKKKIKQETRPKKERKSRTPRGIYINAPKEDITAIRNVFMHGLENEDYEYLRIGAQSYISILKKSNL